MHKIIRKQQALKQKDKGKGVTSGRSDFQRTPAFIQSAVQAALEALAAQAQLEQHRAGGTGQAVGEVPFPSPKGGFTDVGLHTGSQPKATAWPVLKSMVEVSHGLLRRCTLLLMVRSFMLLTVVNIMQYHTDGLTGSVGHSFTT